MPELFVLSGPQLGLHFPLGTEETRIGSAPNSGVRIEDPAVALQHCVISAANDRYCVVDRSDGAGTFVNGKRISAHWLNPGDQISIGGTALLYQTGATMHAAPAANDVLVRACSLIFLF